MFVFFCFVLFSESTFLLLFIPLGTTDINNKASSVFTSINNQPLVLQISHFHTSPEVCKSYSDKC